MWIGKQVVLSLIKKEIFICWIKKLNKNILGTATILYVKTVYSVLSKCRQRQPMKDFQDVEDVEFLIFYLIEAINQATMRLVGIFPERVVCYFFIYCKNKF